MLRAIFPLALILAAGCASDELRLANLLTQKIGIEVRAPKEGLSGGCDQPFRDRFCAEEYQVVGVLDVDPGADRLLTLSDSVDDEHCTNVLWMRLVFLEEVGPVDDPGTLIQLPAEVEVEQGAGALHTVAFPRATVRIDEIGTADEHQAQPPTTCAELGRVPR
jgi:hypothetical protein